MILKCVCLLPIIHFPKRSCVRNLGKWYDKWKEQEEKKKNIYIYIDVSLNYLDDIGKQCLNYSSDTNANNCLSEINKMYPSLFSKCIHLCFHFSQVTNHFSILALRTPWTVWKGKKIENWKMNSPGQ